MSVFQNSHRLHRVPGPSLFSLVLLFRVCYFHNLAESHIPHELHREKRKKKVPCELGNIPRTSSLLLKRSQWILTKTLQAQVCEHEESAK